MNIKDIGALRNCTSCQVCAAVCPKQAISIARCENGFYMPEVSGDLCVDCGLCLKVCYKYDDELDKANHHVNNIIYGAFAKEDYILQNTTSGGVAYLLAKELVNQGYLCVGVVYNIEKDIAEHIITFEESEIEGFKGSKYIQAFSYNAFADILTKYTDQKIAVFGTPCQIYGINKYISFKKKRDNFVLIDIFCHGCPTYFLWEKYLKYIKMKKPNIQYDKVEFRSKHRGWHQYIIGLKNNNIYQYISNSNKDAFFDLFFSNQLLNKSCKDCVLRGIYTFSDIRLGDFWGAKYDMNKKGVSLVELSTKKGVELFNLIKMQVYFKKHEKEDYWRHQSMNSIYSVDESLRFRMLNMLKNEDLTIVDVAKFYWKQQPFTLKVIRFFKTLIKLLPNWFVSFFRKINHA